MDKLNLDNLDFSGEKTKGLLTVVRQSMHGEVTSAILSAIAVAEFQNGTLSKEEKHQIINSVESNFKELVGNQLKTTYGDGIQEHF
ncbi:MAG: hypothetical protein PQJ49_11640 [Sphaerochaetaceae bacterium]|nr:hypothetical protein [Sphaerochaetaceae bacterium]